MHLRILPDHQKLFFNKDIFERLKWLKTCFDVFAHTSRPPESFFQKDIFYSLEWLKTCFDALAHSGLEVCANASEQVFNHSRC
jgi:hypothetical protein